MTSVGEGKTNLMGSAATEASLDPSTPAALQSQPSVPSQLSAPVHTGASPPEGAPTPSSEQPPIQPPEVAPTTLGEQPPVNAASVTKSTTVPALMGLDAPSFVINPGTVKLLQERFENILVKAPTFDADIDPPRVLSRTQRRRQLRQYQRQKAVTKIPPRPRGPRKHIKPLATFRLFQGSSDPLSNFYRCDLPFCGEMFASSEHAYQFSKAMAVNRPRIAEQIQAAPTPARAKLIAKHNLPSRAETSQSFSSEDIMYAILKCKAANVPAFKAELIRCKTAGQYFVECTPDLYWASGFFKAETAKKGPENWPGANVLGKMLDQVASEILAE